jgi:hypothetical protein
MTQPTSPAAHAAGDVRHCLFSELDRQRCSSGGCPVTAADCHRVRKVQFGRSITVWPWPEHCRKRTCGAEPVAQLVLAAARHVSLSRPASVCASTVTCDNTRTCNSTWIVQRMPNSGRCELVYLCAGLYAINGGSDRHIRHCHSYRARRSESGASRRRPPGKGGPIVLRVVRPLKC